MSWTQEQILKFKMDNKQYLQEINKTLQPDKNLTGGKVGIFVPGQAGDLATCMSVLKYRDIVFPNKEIIWFCNFPNADLLRYAPITEVREWFWAGNGLPIGTPDYFPLLCDENNRLNKELAKNYEGTKDLVDGWFPAAHQLSPEKRNGIEYPNISKKIFGIPYEWEWHPVLNFSARDKEMIKGFMSLMSYKKTVCIETMAGSGQSLLDDYMVKKVMQICKDVLDKCNFIFVSNKYLNGNEDFPYYEFDKTNIWFASQYTVRQCALIVAECELLISVSSGISVAASCWNNTPTPILQFCGSKICSTQSLALGEFELVTYDNQPLELAKEEFYKKLDKLLNMKIK